MAACWYFVSGGKGPGALPVGLGVAEKGSVAAPFWTKKFTQNVLEARVTAWREDGSFIVITFEVDYNISVLQ
jgi:hypothetical protein